MFIKCYIRIFSILEALEQQPLHQCCESNFTTLNLHNLHNNLNLVIVSRDDHKAWGLGTWSLYLEETKQILLELWFVANRVSFAASATFISVYIEESPANISKWKLLISKQWKIIPLSLKIYELLFSEQLVTPLGSPRSSD